MTEDLKLSELLLLNPLSRKTHHARTTPHENFIKINVEEISIIWKLIFNLFQ